MPVDGIGLKPDDGHRPDLALPLAVIVPLRARALGYAGLVPLWGGAAAVCLMSGEAALGGLWAQMTYAAVLLGCLGAVHWGADLARGTHDPARLAWSVAPALVGWASLLLQPVPGLVLQMLAFGACFHGDRLAAAADRLPDWYVRLRRPLSVLAVAALGLSLLRLAVWPPLD